MGGGGYCLGKVKHQNPELRADLSSGYPPRVSSGQNSFKYPPSNSYISG